MPRPGQVHTLCISFQTPCQADAVTSTTFGVGKTKLLVVNWKEERGAVWWEEEDP